MVNQADNNGWTPLHIAAENGRLAVAGHLLARGAEVSAGNKDGWRPLHLAAREGHAAAAKLLVARGADVAARTRSGATPLDLATRHRSREWEALAAFLGRATLAEGAQSKGARLLVVDVAADVISVEAGGVETLDLRVHAASRL